MESYPDYIYCVPDYDPVTTKADCVFDNAAAQHAIDFFAEELCLIEGVHGCPLFVLNDWQKAIIGNLFGWKRPDGTRRYRKAFLFIPRKNGKTPLMAGLINYIAFNEDEPGGQIYSSAGEIEQSALIYRHVAGMIAHNESLTERSKCYKTYKSIEFYEGDTFYKALSSDADTKHGQNSHLIINDEIHVHKKRDLIDALDTSVASRTQPLVIDITTAGFDKTTICGERYEYACKVRDGAVDDPYLLPVIYEIKEKDYDRWDSEEVVAYCNPNAGISVSWEYLREELKKAKVIPAKENVFRRLHLNQWTQQETRWLNIDLWNACNNELRSDNRIIWIGGLDLSTSTDLTCLTFLGFDEVGVLHWHTYPFMPEDTAGARERQDNVPYLVWARDGFIELTDGDCVDFNYIEKRTFELCQIYNPAEIAFDRYNATQIIINLQDKGLSMTPYGQGYVSMNPPCKMLEQLVLSGKVAHGNHPVLKWAVSNVEVKIDESENYRPVKPKSVKRIDPVVSGLMALGRLIGESRMVKKSIYETRGAIIL